MSSPLVALEYSPIALTRQAMAGCLEWNHDRRRYEGTERGLFRGAEDYRIGGGRKEECGMVNTKGKTKTKTKIKTKTGTAID